MSDPVAPEAADDRDMDAGPGGDTRDDHAPDVDARDDGSSDHDPRHDADTAPGEEFEHEEIGAGIRGYLVGLALASLLTVASFAVLKFQFVWGPAIPVALVVFAIAQMGVHLVFFLHITTGPDNTNNVMALAFGVLIVVLLLGGSLWIMSHLNQAMTHAGPYMRM